MSKIFAVDYGTSGMSVARTTEYGSVQMLRDRNGNSVIPTILALGKEWKHHIYGEAARQGQAVYECISSAKTNALKKEAFTKEGVKYQPAYVISTDSSLVLAEMEEVIAQPIEEIVVSYPDYMDQLGPEAKHTYRGLFENNMKPGGALRQVRGMISESQAAALSIWNPEQEDVTRFVLDIGGGTTDLSVVEIRKVDGQYYVLAKCSYGKILGGDDFDQYFYEEFEKQMISQGIEYQKDIKLMKELRLKCEEIKINMSTRKDEEVEFYLFSNFNNKYVRLVMKKEKHNAILMKFWRQVKSILDDYTKMIEPAQIDEILLVGGTCSNVILQKHLKEYFSKGAYQNVKVIAHKEKTAVAIGAANYAHWTFDEQETIYLGVQPPKKEKVNVEIECSDSLGLMCVMGEESCIANIIRKGNTFPCTYTSNFVVAEDGQNNILFQVYWNESNQEIVKLEEGIYVGEVIIDLSKMYVTTKDCIQVTFTMPSQGIVNAEVTFTNKAGESIGYLKIPNPFQFTRNKGV